VGFPLILPEEKKSSLMNTLKSSSNSSSIQKSEEKKARISQNMAYFPPSQFREKSPEINVLLNYQAIECLVENNTIC
jgi:hypothetical protein